MSATSSAPNAPSAAPSSTLSTTATRSLALAWVGVAVVLTALASPIGSATQHANRLWLAAVALALIMTSVIVKARPGRGPRGRWWLSLALGAACIFGVFNYYGFQSKRFTGVAAHADVTYYYLNSKYFDELGYYELYPAMLVADKAHRHRLDHIDQFRDLHSYRNVPVRRAHERRDEVRRRFSDARWAAFTHDLDYFLATGTRGGWAYFLKDHGYNAPPTWTVVGQRFSSLCPVEYIAWITQIDTLLLSLAFGAVALTFGGHAMGFCLLFYLTTASGQWPVLGSSLLRFDWLAALLGAACAFRRERHALAGGLLAYAACNRIFPAIFFLPWFAAAVTDLWRTRKLAIADRHVIGGALAVVIVLVGGALLTQGPAAFASAAENLLLHNSAKSYSSYRVGLGDALLFQGERSRAHIIGGIPAKEAELAALKPMLHVIGLAVIALIAGYVARCRPPRDLAIALGFFPFFVLTTPQINYFNLRVLLVLWHVVNLRHPRHAFGLAALFAIEAMAAGAKVGGAIEYTWTSMTSVGLTLYGTVMLVGLVRDLVTAKDESDPGDAFTASTLPRQLAAVVAAAALCATVFVAYWTAQRAPEPTRTIGIDRLATVQQPGAAWNGAGTVSLDASGVIVTLGHTSRANTLDISFDNNDEYVVRYVDGEDEVGQQVVKRSADSPNKGLAVRTVTVPAGASRAGFDRLVVIPRGGDGMYSLGHLVLDTPAN